jgi:hypothetical protein
LPGHRSRFPPARNGRRSLRETPGSSLRNEEFAADTAVENYPLTRPTVSQSTTLRFSGKTLFDPSPFKDVPWFPRTRSLQPHCPPTALILQPRCHPPAPVRLFRFSVLSY